MSTSSETCGSWGTHHGRDHCALGKGVPGLLTGVGGHRVSAPHWSGEGDLPLPCVWLGWVW